MPQITRKNQETIRIKMLIDNQALTTETQRQEDSCQLEEESGFQTPNGMKIPKMTLMGLIGGTTPLKKEKAVQTDPNPAAQEAQRPSVPQISNQTLHKFLHKKLTTLFLNADFYKEFQNYTKADTGLREDEEIEEEEIILFASNRWVKLVNEEELKREARMG
ncbi:uncharacterized protein BT62DRAFT_923767 [Guyanagaster necrorhizus]|uniref:Uncharacterized protein n=1 Tax=Guyanagaster necrorhizus TaxID=856835 RepID=A0A9P7VIZ9_9AGAR|nr:uncharacterized protein BT62DRAFT_923767 [Guyanagaster necrorhizus MCA 3950]KAG7440906.1 hypothetical protein BT62DRAFT_923767 [Guyanagaster necrorhizus MCA 3950]